MISKAWRPAIRLVETAEPIEVVATFGAAEAWSVMNELWRGAPASPGAAVPNSDQSRFSPGVWEIPRSMPIWRREFYQGGQYRATMAKIDRLLVWVEWKAYERFRESEQNIWCHCCHAARALPALPTIAMRVLSPILPLSAVTLTESKRLGA